MYYIFNSEQKIIGWCNYEPDVIDLKSRNETFIYCEEFIKNPLKLLVGKYGSLFEPADNPLTDDEKYKSQVSKLVNQRNKLLLETDWMVNRHLEQKMLNITTNLTEEDFQVLLDYRQRLRDITTMSEFPYVDIQAPIFNS